MPSVPWAASEAPRVYYAREATPGRFVEIFERLRRDLGITMNSGRIGIKLHGDEVRITGYSFAYEGSEDLTDYLDEPEDGDGGR